MSDRPHVDVTEHWSLMPEGVRWAVQDGSHGRCACVARCRLDDNGLRSTQRMLEEDRQAGGGYEEVPIGCSR